MHEQLMRDVKSWSTFHLFMSDGTAGAFCVDRAPGFGTKCGRREYEFVHQGSDTIMASKHASISIMWDWDTLPATVADTQLMTAVRELFTITTVDTYGRDGITHNKLWILQGNTPYTLRAFTDLLTTLIPPSDIMHFSFGYD